MFNVKNVSLLHAHIVSLKKNIHKLEELLTELKFAPDKIALTETQLLYTDDINFVQNLKEYNFIYVTPDS